MEFEKRNTSEPMKNQNHKWYQNSVFILPFLFLSIFPSIHFSPSLPFPLCPSLLPHPSFSLSFSFSFPPSPKKNAMNQGAEVPASASQVCTRAEEADGGDVPSTPDLLWSPRWGRATPRHLGPHCPDSKSCFAIHWPQTLGWSVTHLLY